MLELPAYLGVFVTLGLVLARPRLGPVFRVGPALAALVGVTVMLAFGVVDRSHISSTAGLMWRPLVAIASIMVTTGVAQRVGLLDWLASRAELLAGGGARRLFAMVYVLGALTAAVLNNDSAILLLTPLVIVLARRRYPARPAILLAFIFAVFMSAGVAPLIVSNPMNMIVASYAGIDFNQYARVMAPIAAAGWVIGFVILRLIFARAIKDADQAPAVIAVQAPPSPAQKQSLALVLIVLCAYPVVAYSGAPVWTVAVGGAILSLVLAAKHRIETPRRILASGISWNILAFLFAVSILGVGLRNVGVVARLSDAYARGGSIAIAVVSALGSAVVNNHPMSIMNMLAIRGVPGAGQRETLAALIGGDIGPRLLPMGSLAGLLWLESLRRLDVKISVVRFAAIGVAVTVPTLAASIGILYLLT